MHVSRGLCHIVLNKINQTNTILQICTKKTNIHSIQISMYTWLQQVYTILIGQIKKLKLSERHYDQINL